MKKEEIEKIKEYYKNILPEEAQKGIDEIYERIKELENIQEVEKSKNLSKIKRNINKFSLLSLIRVAGYK